MKVNQMNETINVAKYFLYGIVGMSLIFLILPFISKILILLSSFLIGFEITQETLTGLSFLISFVLLLSGVFAIGGAITK